MGLEAFRKIKSATEMVRVAHGYRQFEKSPGSKPKTIGIDGDVARVFFPTVNKYVSILFDFPSLKARDEFLASERTKEDFFGNGGAISFYPESASDIARAIQGDAENNENESRDITYGTLAKWYGVSAAEIHNAQIQATAAWIEAQRRMKRESESAV